MDTSELVYRLDKQQAGNGEAIKQGLLTPDRLDPARKVCGADKSHGGLTVSRDGSYLVCAAKGCTYVESADAMAIVAQAVAGKKTTTH